jgi:hypothetical protein
VRIDRDRRNEARVIEWNRASALAIAVRVQGPVQCDSIDPSEEFAAPLELWELVIGLQKSILRDVVGVARLAGQMEGERVHARPVFSDELIERGRVSCLGSVDQLGGFGAVPLCFG